MDLEIDGVISHRDALQNRDQKPTDHVRACILESPRPRCRGLMDLESVLGSDRSQFKDLTKPSRGLEQTEHLKSHQLLDLIVTVTSSVSN